MMVLECIPYLLPYYAHMRDNFAPIIGTTIAPIVPIPHPYMVQKGPFSFTRLLRQPVWRQLDYAREPQYGDNYRLYA